MRGYCYVWSFKVAPERRAGFEAAYGPSGAWSKLFSRDPAWLGTELLRDRERPGHYLTVDHWLSKEGCSAFRERRREELDALDAECGQWTLAERKLGDYDRI